MTSVFENEKKFRKGKKFKPKKTRGNKFRKDISSAIKESNIRKRRDKLFKLEPGSTAKPKNITNTEKSFGISLENLKKDFRFPKKGTGKKPPIEFKRRKPPNKPRRVPGEQKEMIPLRPEGRGRIIDGEFYPAMAKGGRAGFKAGSKGCKLAMKGKGRAYGKNS